MDAGFDPAFDPMEYGTAVHMLLEHGVGAADDIDPKYRNMAVAEAGAIFQNPALAHLFDTDTTLAEVQITAHLDALDGQSIYGAIDRLIVTDTTVTAIDFKTNQMVPSTPDQTPSGILRQMAAYHAALQKIYPSHEIQAQILWTKTGDLMTIPPHIMVGSLVYAPAS